MEGFLCFADWIWLNVIPHQQGKRWKSWCQEGRLRGSCFCQGCDLERLNDPWYVNILCWYMIWYDMMIYVYIWYDDICRYMIWLWHIYENQLKWYIIHWLLSMVIFGIQLLEDWEVCRSIHGPRKSVLLRAWSPHREMARRKWHTTGGTSDESCLMQNSWQISFEPADVLITNDFRWKAWNKKLGLYRCLQLRSPSSRQWHNLATGLFVWYARIAPPQSKQAWMGFKMFQDVLS